MVLGIVEGESMEKVSIVLAVYKPNVIFLTKQLESINNQTYKNIELIIRHDNLDDNEYAQIVKISEKKLIEVKYRILRNSERLGSNKTFELLTLEAEGDYIAYCDQDDIWDEKKIKKLLVKLKTNHSVMCYSDLKIINENDDVLFDSIMDANPRIKHKAGTNLFEYLLTRNFVTGCSLLIKKQIAIEAIPFCDDYYIHDHWLTIISSLKGSIAYIEEPLTYYRIHEKNQIGISVLKNISTKDEYFRFKIMEDKNRLVYLLNHKQFDEPERKLILEAIRKVDVRIEFFRNLNVKNIINLLMNNNDLQLVVFEIVISITPISFSERFLKLFKK